MKLSLHLLIILLIGIPGHAQQHMDFSANDNNDNYSGLLESQKSYMFKTYYQKVGGKDELANGKEYFPYYFRSKQKPILFPNKKHSASIIFNGRKYRDINLEYDTYTDEVIYTDLTRFNNYRTYKIALNSNPIESFILKYGSDSLLFRQLKSDDGINFNLTNGFYEIAYEGGCSYLIRHRSLVFEKDGKDEYFYTPENYVMVEDIYSRVKSLKSFIKLFGEKSDLIKKFIRSNNVDIRKADKNQIIKILKYYDSMLAVDK